MSMFSVIGLGFGRSGPVGIVLVVVMMVLRLGMRRQRMGRGSGPFRRGF